MGTTVSRHLRDLSELAGCEAVDDFTPAPVTPTTVGPTSSSSRPCTPAPTPTPRVLHLDPRSPTAEIVRTPIERVPSPYTEGIEDSPVASFVTSRRSYLETDLDSLATQEHTVKPITEVCVTPKPDMVLPAGLTHAHLLKLRFLGIDPRSPSSGIIRTPIQVKSSPQSVYKAVTTTNNQDDTLSIGSVSSQDVCNLSINNCSSLYDFSRDCSDPSAFISEIEEIEVEESLEDEEQNVSKPAKDESHETLETECVKGQDIEPASALADIKSKAAPGKLAVFCEDDLDSSLICEKSTVPITPDTTSVTKRSRTPLTPLCNHNMTPNKVIRAKLSQSIQKENIVKVNMYNNDDKAKMPSKQALSTRQAHSAKSTGLRDSPVKSGRKVTGLGSDNSEPRRRILAQWDHDTTIII